MPSGLWDGAPWGPVGWLVTGAGKCGCKWLLRSDLPAIINNVLILHSCIQSDILTNYWSPAAPRHSKTATTTTN